MKADGLDVLGFIIGVLIVASIAICITALICEGSRTEKCKAKGGVFISRINACVKANSFIQL